MVLETRDFRKSTGLTTFVPQLFEWIMSQAIWLHFEREWVHARLSGFMAVVPHSSLTCSRPPARINSRWVFPKQRNEGTQYSTPAVPMSSTYLETHLVKIEHGL